MDAKEFKRVNFQFQFQFQQSDWECPECGTEMELLTPFEKTGVYCPQCDTLMERTG